MAATPAQALTLFTGPYAPANWTQSIGGDGSINTGDAPNSVTLTGAINFSFFDINTDFTISAPVGGTVSFDWFYTTNDEDPYDPFGYLLNGSFNQLTNDSGSKTQSGSAAFDVVTGVVFGFRQISLDSASNLTSTTIAYFNAPVPGPLPLPVPGPLPLIGAGAAFGWSRRLRHRLAQPLATPPQA
ncbi:MAG: hypothetical protein ACK550_14440 [Synechococcaceae cyanobacterium]